MKLENNLFILEETEDIYTEGNTLPLRIFAKKQDDTIMHGHDFAEIVFISSGSGIQSSFRKQIKLEPGDILFVPQEGIHSYIDTDKLELVNILFNPLKLHLAYPGLHKLNLFREFFLNSSSGHVKQTRIGYMKIPQKNHDDIKLIIDQMIRESAENNEEVKQCLIGYFIVLLSKLSGMYNFDNKKIIPESVDKVIEFIHKNIQDNIQLKQLVKVSGLSQSSFQRYFAEFIGNSPMNYLNDLRLAKACAILRKTDKRISEIAYEVGFNDSNYFSRLFCIHFDMPPREYRKAYSSYIK